MNSLPILCERVNVIWSLAFSLKQLFFLFRIKHFLLHKLNHYLTGHEGTSINWLFALSQTITRTTQFYSFARILWAKNNFVKKIPFYVDNKLMVSQKNLGGNQRWRKKNKNWSFLKSFEILISLICWKKEIFIYQPNYNGNINVKRQAWRIVEIFCVFMKFRKNVFWDYTHL